MELSWTWPGLVVIALIVAACFQGYQKGLIKELVSAFFMIFSILIVWGINPCVNTFIREYTPVYEQIRERCSETVTTQLEGKTGINREEQNQIVENLNIPDLLKQNLINNNTVETYRYLAVSSFTDYVADSLAVMVVNGLSFLLSYFISALGLRLICYVLGILSKLPVINGLNKLAGAVVGGGKCVIFIWIAFVILTLLCNTTIGQTGLELVKKDQFLNFLYDKNIFIKVFMSVFYGK